MNSPYQPPTSRPAHGGIARPPRRSTLWHGFGLGWAAIAFTFLWVVVAVPLFSRFVAIGNGFESILSLVLLFAPTLALLAYFAARKEWKGSPGRASHLGQRDSARAAARGCVAGDTGCGCLAG